MSPLAISLRFLQTQPDERLVTLARDGHERAFEALVRRYRSQLLAYCRRVAPRGTPPEDILQQGLLQAWRALSGGAEVRDARAWLYRIVHNVAITALRASGELPDGVIAPPGAPGVEQIVEQRMAARDALEGLAALPDLQRQVMVSTALDGRSHEEIAAALGLSSGSVRGLIYRARSTLRAAAAALIPAPVIDWALGDAGATTAGVAGAGSAGLGALILKGSAILAVGAVAGTAAIVAGHRSHHARQSQGSTAAARAGDEAGAGQATVTRGDAARAAFTVAAGAAQPAVRDEQRDRSRDGRSPGGGGRDHSGDGGGPGQRGSDGGGGSGSGDGGGGSDGGTTTTSGSDGGDRGATTATSGSDGGGDHGTTTTTSGQDGGGSSGSSDGGSFSGPLGSGSLGGGSSGSSDGGGSGGGSDGGSSTTTTTTTTTTDGGH